jgi:hypothetical protein
VVLFNLEKAVDHGEHSEHSEKSRACAKLFNHQSGEAKKA